MAGRQFEVLLKGLCKLTEELNDNDCRLCARPDENVMSVATAEKPSAGAYKTAELKQTHEGR